MEDPHDPGLPEGPEDLPQLAADLARLQDATPAVPDDVDRRLRQAIAGHFTAQSMGGSATVTARRAFPWRIAAGGLAAAAVIAVATVAWIVRPAARHAPMETQMASPAETLDRDGRVNILDAFRLALRVESGDAVDVSFDLNGDGVIDRADVDGLALRAVALEGAGS